MSWITFLVYLFAIKEIFKVKFEKKYVEYTKTTHVGFSFKIFSLGVVIHYVAAEKNDYFTGKKVGFSNYKRKGRRGVGLSFLERNLLFLIKKRKQGEPASN